MHVLWMSLRFVLCPMDVSTYIPQTRPVAVSTSPHHHEAASVEASCARTLIIALAPGFLGECIGFRPPFLEGFSPSMFGD